MEVGALDRNTLRNKNIGTSLVERQKSSKEDILITVININQQTLHVARKVVEEVKEVFGQKDGAKHRTSGAKPTIVIPDWGTVDEMGDLIGGRLVNFILQSDFMENTAPIQLAIQSILVNGIYSILLTLPLKLTDPLDISESFWKLYESIVRSGECNIVMPVSSDLTKPS